MKLVWTGFATDNLQAIHDHIAQTSSDYARSTIQRITARASQIETFPFPAELFRNSKSTRSEKFLLNHTESSIAFVRTGLTSLR